MVLYNEPLHEFQSAQIIWLQVRVNGENKTLTVFVKKVAACQYWSKQNCYFGLPKYLPCCKKNHWSKIIVFEIHDTKNTEAVVQRCSVKRCSWKLRKIYRKAPLPGSLFNKVVGLRLATLLKKRLWHRCFPVNFWWLLLKIFPTKEAVSCNRF